MRFLTPAVRVIAVFSAAGEHPVASDRFFLQTSEPATSLEPPATAAGATEAWATPAGLAHANRLAAEYGGRFLTLDEVHELMPD